MGQHLVLCVSPGHVFLNFLFISEGLSEAVGELCEGNTDINLPQHAGQTQTHQSGFIEH